MNKPTKQKGFTIIEVVLVLAIAGLIFLMVFIALPALQRNQRDSQRKNDIGRLQTAIVSYQSNNRNNLPAADSGSWNAFADTYLRPDGDTFDDPSFGPYVFTYSSTIVQPGDSDRVSDTGKIFVVGSSTCQGDTVVGSTGTRKVSVLIKLEGGGVYCVNN